MKLLDIKDLAAQVKTLTAKAKATGPKSERGKTRSALNAVRHGLAGKHLLLPGEDGVEYERRLDAFFEALAPADEAQAQLVALVADDLWKLERLGKMEQGVTLGRIEELLALTSSNRPANEIAAALAALMSGLCVWEQQPLPTERGAEFDHRMHGITRALEMATSAGPDLPRELMAMVNDLVGKLCGERGDQALAMDGYFGLGHVARLVLDELAVRAQQLDAAEDDMRKAIAAMALPDEQELKKLSRYRKMLEEGLQRRLVALEQLRKLGIAAAKTEEDKNAAREYRLKLRVVA